MGVEHRWWLLASILFGLLSTNITFTIFNVALVDIARSLHSNAATLTWSITGPLLVVGVAAPLVGKFGDTKGHRRLYLFGLVGSLACALLTAACWNAPSLIVARLFSGFEGACTSATSWALLFRVFGPGERSRVLGWWSLVGAGGPVIGVAVGGPVVDAFGWRWVFLAQAPLILVAIVVNYFVVPDTERAPEQALDLPGAALLAVAIGAILLAVNEAGHGITSPLVAGSAGVGVLAGVAFTMVERRASSPVFPLQWLSRRDFTFPCVAAAGLQFAYMGGFFLTPLFLEQALHYSVGSAGLFQIARPLTFALVSPAAGYLAVRAGDRRTAAAGAVVMASSMAVFMFIRPGAPAVVIFVALAASGLGSGLSVAPLAALVANSADADRMGSASAGMQVASQVGVVAGIQVMATVQLSRLHHVGLVGSFHDAYLAGVGVAVAALVATMAITRRRGAPVRARSGRAEAAIEAAIG